MKRPIAQIGLGMAAGALALGAVPQAVAAAPERPTTTVSQQAEAEPVVCDRREILLLIDQSKSLRKSDPSNERISGAQALVAGLAGAGVPARLSVAGFGSTVTEPESFDLGTPEADAAATAAIAEFATRKGDRNTDYVLAMRAAVEHFDNSDVAPGCKTLVWFTDGAHDIEQAPPEFVGSYTTLTDPKQIVEQFEAAVCGPVPSEFTFTQPLAEQIREFEFVVRLIDLRGSMSDSQAKKRERTDLVLNRLLTNGEGDCGINGERITVGQADELVETFFREAQIQSGRRAVDCAVLQNGVPASILASASVLAVPATAKIEVRRGDELTVADQPYRYEASESDRARDIAIGLSAVDGELRSCFVDVSATIEAVGEPSLYRGASTPLYLAVGAPGIASTPLAGVGEEAVRLTATVDGVPVPLSWDSAANQWIGIADLPTPSGTLEVVGDFVGPLEGLGQVEPLSEEIPVKDVPGVPQIRWDGDAVVEGATASSGTLKIEPTADTDAEVCFQFNLPADLVGIEDGAELGQFIAEETRVCGPAREVLELAVTLDIAQTANARGTAAIEFTGTYTPTGEPPKDMGRGQVITPEFTLAKPVDSGVQLRLALGLAAASALLTYLLMLGLTRAQAKLRPAADMLVVRTPLSQDPATMRCSRADTNGSIPLKDFKPVLGSRTRYELGDGIVVRRRLSPNPFRGLSAVVESSDVPVLAHPAHGGASRKGRRVPVPLRFGTLIVVPVGSAVTHALALVPIGTTPSTASALIDEGIRRLDSQIREVPTAPIRTEPDSTPLPSTGITHPPSRPATASAAPSLGANPSGSTDEFPSAGNAAASTRTPPPPPHRR